MGTFDDMMRDKAQVRASLYSDPAKLGARVDLQRRFSTNPTPIADWELSLVDLAGVRQALDAGCGTGAFLVPLARRLAPQGGAVIGLDLSEGTLGEAQRRVQAEGLPATCVIGDVEALPFDDGAFDLALANYMLYHVPELDHALGELRRVLRPGGTLLAAANGEGHMRELWQLVAEALARLGFPAEALAAARERGRIARGMSFRLENGAEALRRHFSDVRLERYPDDLRVTEVEPLVAYVASMWSLDAMLAVVAPPEHEREALRTRLIDSFRALVEERLATDGVVRIFKDTGAFVCTHRQHANAGA